MLRPWKKLQVFTCISCVHKEFSHFEGVGFYQPFSKGLDPASLPDLCLANNDLEGAVGHMLAILPHAHLMLTDLLRSKGDTCGGEQKQDITFKKKC